MKWTAILYNSLGCELDRVTADSREDLNFKIRGWSLNNGDSIRIEGPEE